MLILHSIQYLKYFGNKLAQKLMRKDYPLFTVIIPTKNRAEYLKYTLKTCVLQEYPNFMIIVSDDCSDDNSVEIVNAYAQIDDRIKLYAHDKHLGMRDNFEFALSKVKPGYVMALGGDDGLIPGCIQRMFEILEETQSELLTWTPAAFSYPTFDGDESIFYVRRKHAPHKIIKSEEFLTKLTQTFNYQVPGCPMFYIQGVASTKLIDRVKSRTPDQCFYYCPTPDGFSGVVLAGEVENYTMSYEPLSIIGTTKKSQGQNYRRTDEQSRKEAEEFFNDNIRRRMHKELASQPYSPLSTLMTADYLLTARDLPGWPGKMPTISFELLLKKSFELIANGTYDNDVLIRELKILREIAIQHDLLSQFNKLYKKTKKIIGKDRAIKGFAYTHSIRFPGNRLNINNIYDASLATNFVYDFFGIFSIREFIEMLINSVIVIYARYGYHKTTNLPKILSDN